MDAGAMEATAHVGDVGESVQVTQDADPVDNDDVGTGGSAFPKPGRGQTSRFGPTGDSRDVAGRGLVRRNDQTSRATLRVESFPRRKENGIVGRPGGSRHEGWTRGAQWGEQVAGAIDALRSVPHLVVPRVAGNRDRPRS